MAATNFSGPVVSTNGFAPGSGSVKDVTGATTLTTEDNGKIISLNAAAGAAITLPPLHSVPLVCQAASILPHNRRGRNSTMVLFLSLRPNRCWANGQGA